MELAKIRQNLSNFASKKIETTEYCYKLWIKEKDGVGWALP